MEIVTNNDDFSSLKENRITGNPKMSNSKITFQGSGNVLYCENNVNLVNCSILFGGSNSLIYLSSTNSNYSFNLHIFQNSVVFIGRDNNLTPPININIQEHQNLIIGDEGIIGSGTNIRTSDAHIVYDINTKKRINHSGSVLIGDHVWLGHLSYVSKGVNIGSGTIIDNYSYVPSNVKLESNNLYGGNPIKLLKKEIFFTKDYVGNFEKEYSDNVDEYISGIYVYSPKSGETLDFNKVFSLLSSFNVEEKLDFIEKLFIRNKKHDRFSI